MVQSGLVGHWPLHEWSGRANDLSGNDNHGTVNGATQGVAGKSGLTSYSFDNTDDRVQTTFSTTDTNDTFTLSIWIKEDAIERDTFIGGDSKRNSPIVRVSSTRGNIEYFPQSTSDFEWSGVLSNTEWKHIVLTHNQLESRANLYVNTVLQNPSSETTDNLVDGHDWSIGSRGNNTDNFGGELSDFRIYNRALSPQEIQHLYEIGSVDVATPPAEEDSAAVARYAFDDRSDPTTALDTFGSNDGTINGATYSTDSIRGLSMSFDSSNNEYIDVPNTFGIFDGSSDLTISTWLNTDSTGSDKHIFSPLAEYDWQFKVYRDETLRMENFDGSNVTVVSSTEALSPNSWYHATFVYDSSETSGSVYINGVNDGSGTMQSDPQTLSADNYIGAKGGGSQYFNGQMDDLRIYDRALSDYEVQQLYLWGTRGTDRRYEVLQQ